MALSLQMISYVLQCIGINFLNAECVHACLHKCLRVLIRTWQTIVTTLNADIACKNVLISHNSMVHANASCTRTLQVYAQSNCKEPHFSDMPLLNHFINASLQYSKNKNARRPDQCSISCLFPSLFCRKGIVPEFVRCNKPLLAWIEGKMEKWTWHG